MLVRGKIVVEGRAVRNESHFAALTAIRRVERSALEKDDALRRIRPSRKTSEQRRFTGSVLPIRKASSPAFKENEASRNTSNPPYENARSLTSNANGAEAFAVEGTECRSFEGKGGS